MNRRNFLKLIGLAPVFPSVLSLKDKSSYFSKFKNVKHITNTTVKIEGTFNYNGTYSIQNINALIKKLSQEMNFTIDRYLIYGIHN